MSHEVYNYICIGDSGVGKSCFLQQFTDQKSNPVYEPTGGVHMVTRTITIGNKTFKLQILDTDGEESSESVMSSHYKGVVGVLLVYDVTRRETFNNLLSRIDGFRDATESNKLTIMLVGNKCDIAERRVVSTKEGEQFAKQHGLIFMEASAKTAQCVNEAFVITTTAIRNKIMEEKVNKIMDEKEEEMEKMHIEIKELKKAVEKRDEFIQKMFEGCKAFLSQEENKPTNKPRHLGSSILFDHVRPSYGSDGSDSESLSL